MCISLVSQVPSEAKGASGVRETIERPGTLVDVTGLPGTIEETAGGGLLDGCLRPGAHRRTALPRQRQHAPLRGCEGAGPGGPPRRITIRGHPDRRHHLRLADVDAAHPVPVQRLFGT
jgi:hypothetical protein